MVCEQYQYYNNLDKLTHILQDYSINTLEAERTAGWLTNPTIATKSLTPLMLIFAKQTWGPKACGQNQTRWYLVYNIQYTVRKTILRLFLGIFLYLASQAYCYDLQRLKLIRFLRFFLSWGVGIQKKKKEIYLYICLLYHIISYHLSYCSFSFSTINLEFCAIIIFMSM